MSDETRVVSSDEVAAYEGLVLTLAHRHSSVDRKFMVEMDDLAQEGRIAVWESLRRGIWPSREFVENAMRDWVRKCSRMGMGGFEDLSSVDEELSLLTMGLV